MDRPRTLFKGLKVNFFGHFYILFFKYFLDLKNYKLRPLRSFLGSLHFSLLFFIYTILGPILKYLKTRSETTL